MFIPYQNGQKKHFESESDVIFANTMTHDVSGNVGLGLESDHSSGSDLYELLCQESRNDPLWYQDQFTNQQKVIQGMKE